MSWDNETELPEACYASTGIEYKKKIYLFGGISNYGLQKKAWTYDLETKKWTAMKNLPNIRNYMSCEIWNDNIYLLGGWGIDIELMSVKTPQILKYSIAENKWYLESELPYALTNIATCIHDNSLYVLGGMTKKKEFTKYITVSLSFRYDLVNKVWYYFSTLPNPKKDFTTKVINNEMYIFGGCRNDIIYDDIWKYSRIEKEWIFQGTLPISLCAYSIIIKNNYLYLLGGMTDNFTVTKDIWRIDINEINLWKWDKVTELPIQLSYFMSITDKKYIYLMGGFTNRYMTKRQVYRLDLFPWKMERVLWIGFVNNSIFSSLPAELIRIIIKKLK